MALHCITLHYMNININISIYILNIYSINVWTHRYLHIKCLHTDSQWDFARQNLDPGDFNHGSLGLKGESPGGVRAKTPKPVEIKIGQHGVRSKKKIEQS